MPGPNYIHRFFSYFSGSNAGFRRATWRPLIGGEESVYQQMPHNLLSNSHVSKISFNKKIWVWERELGITALAGRAEGGFTGMHICGVGVGLYIIIYLIILF